jgi:hypothetical protein
MLWPRSKLGTSWIQIRHNTATANLLSSYEILDCNLLDCDTG